MDEPPSLTPAQRLARQSFDLEKAMAELPLAEAPQSSVQGSAGVRLRPHLVANIPGDMLRESAEEQLGAKRCSAKYLEALRVVLGNQADAERKRYRLELNIRVPFATERTMRNIIDQMKRVGITHGVPTVLGDGRSQCVQCFGSVPNLPHGADLEEVLRAEEALMDEQVQAKVWEPAPLPLPPNEVPH